MEQPPFGGKKSCACKAARDFSTVPRKSPSSSLRPPGTPVQNLTTQCRRAAQHLPRARGAAPGTARLCAVSASLPRACEPAASAGLWLRDTSRSSCWIGVPLRYASQRPLEQHRMAEWADGSVLGGVGTPIKVGGLTRQSRSWA
eukprot:3388502-Rhodomonas_salina.1